MALELKYCIKKANDCSKLFIKDSTGNYSVDNLTGYGTPNPTQASLYTFVEVKRYQDTVVLPMLKVVNPDYDFEVSSVSDGLYSVILNAVFIYNPANLLSYTDNQVLWDSVNDRFVRISIPSGTLTPILQSSILDTELVSKSTEINPELFLCNGHTCYKKEVLKSLSCKCGCKGDCKCSKSLIFIKGVEFNYQMGFYTEVNQLLKSLNKVCNCKNCKDC